jgi:hypothetical protein
MNDPLRIHIKEDHLKEIRTYVRDILNVHVRYNYDPLISAHDAIGTMQGYARQIEHILGLYDIDVEKLNEYVELGK